MSAKDILPIIFVAVPFGLVTVALCVVIVRLIIRAWREL